MPVSASDIISRAQRVGIGDSGLGGKDDALRVTLGSCVGLCLVWARQSRFALAHVLLPNPRNGTLRHGGSRYASTAAPFLLDQLGVSRVREVVAYAAGGGRMFTGSEGGHRVGPQNVEALQASLEELRIRLVQSDFGGEEPRQLAVDGQSRQVVSVRMGDSPATITWELPAQFERKPLR